MFGADAARSVVAWLLALNFLAGQAAALPITDSDMAQTIVESGPDASRIRLVVIDPSEAITRVPSAHDEPFDLDAVRVQAGALWRKWSRLETAIRSERDMLEHCRNGTAPCPPAAESFLAIVAAGQAHTGRARLGQINRAINMAIRPMSDMVQHGVVDRWSSPLATLAAGLGDCEDYAIAKYVALVEAGVPQRDLRLVIVRDETANVDHAMVAAYLDGRWIALDNRHLVLVAIADLRRIVPLFALDAGGVKRFVPASTIVASAREPAQSNAVPAGF